MTKDEKYQVVEALTRELLAEADKARGIIGFGSNDREYKIRVTLRIHDISIALRAKLDEPTTP